MMHIFNIYGGLGNQMFQFAAGRAFEARTGKPVRFYTGEFKGYELHNGFELPSVFNLDVPTVAPSDLRDLLGFRANSVVQKALTHARWLPAGRHLCLEYDDSLLDLGAYKEEDTFFRGYWQSDAYFSHCPGLIRTGFSFVLPGDELNLKLRDVVVTSESVSVHVRRGDYLSNPKNLKIFAQCPLDYYDQAIQYLGSRHENLNYFIFTDDPAWVQDNLVPKIPNCKLITHNTGRQCCYDLWLMSQCKHHILANSSFSWWAGWLGNHPEKQVIIPERWYLDPCRVRHPYPEGWVPLANMEKS